MAYKRASSKPLEWVASSPGVSVGGGGTEEQNKRLVLGLRDDEVAEIHKIIVITQLREDFDAGKTVCLITWVSMDPDTKYDVNLMEDLETIIFDTRCDRSKGIHVGVEEITHEDQQDQYDFNPPILVGTDLGLGLYMSTAVGVLDAGSTAQIRVFFTRRKAKVPELNQILLKRR